MDRVEDLLCEYLEDVMRTNHSRAMAFKQLRATADIAAFPTDLLQEFVTLTPSLYNPGSRRFEFARTPNKYPAGQIVFAAAGALGIRGSAISVGQLVALDLAPTDGTVWKVLGGMLTATAAVQAQVRQEQGVKSITNLLLPNGVPVPFTCIGNGVQLDMGKSVEIAVSAAATILFQLFISEETETMARGAV
jgi:hypothetical protein